MQFEALKLKTKEYKEIADDYKKKFESREVKVKNFKEEFGKMKLIVQEELSKYVNYEKTAGGENKFSS